MIKSLFFMAALLVPGLAYSGNPSANLPVQIVPAGSSPAVPAAAQAAGFATLAANWDFSQPAWAEPNTNWLDCAANNDALTFHVGSPGIPLMLPCNMHQATDPVTGDTVLNGQYLQSYNGLGLTGQQNQVAFQTYNIGTGHTSLSFPQFYVEVEQRVNAPYCGGHNSGGPTGFYTWGVPDPPLEMDFTELWMSDCGYGNAGFINHQNGATAGWESFKSNNLPPGWVQTDYHRYGLLFTSDGSTSAYICGFVDDRLQYCGNANLSASQFTARNIIVYGVTDIAPPALADLNHYTRHFRVWSCSNWSSQQCNGSTLFSGTQDGVTLTYWH
jgi:hypothetical protein